MPTTDTPIRHDTEFVQHRYIVAYRFAFLVMFILGFGTAIYADVTDPGTTIGLMIRAVLVIGMIVHELHLNMAFGSDVPPIPHIPSIRSRPMWLRILLITVIGLSMFLAPDIITAQLTIGTVVTAVTVVLGFVVYTYVKSSRETRVADSSR